MAKPFQFIKNLDTGAILPWHSGFETYKGLNYEPYFGDLSEAADAAPATISPDIASAATTIAELQAQVKALQEQKALTLNPGEPAKNDAEEEAVRIASVKQAIAKVDIANYAQAQGGFPAQPKVNDIKVLTGFNDVTREEIQAAML
jgi:hypothetical protein